MDYYVDSVRAMEKGNKETNLSDITENLLLEQRNEITERTT